MVDLPEVSREELLTNTDMDSTHTESEIGEGDAATRLWESLEWVTKLKSNMVVELEQEESELEEQRKGANFGQRIVSC